MISKYVLHTAFSILAIFGCIYPSTTFASTLFYEDFESYAYGSNVIGQNGWTDEYGGGVYRIQIDAGIGLTTKVANGRHEFYNIQTAIKMLSESPDPNQITTLTFFGYGSSQFPPSTNSGVGLISGPGLSNPIGGVWWDINNDSGGWSFDARGISGGDFNDLSKRFTVPGHYDEVGKFSIIIDGLNMEVYGIAEFASEVFTTSRLPVNNAEISAVDKIMMFQDNQVNLGRLGAEFDNIVVTSVPEPATVVLWVLGALVISYRLRGRN